MKVLILSCDDWQGFFIDGKLIHEGHTFHEGDDLYLLKMSEKYGFKSADVTTAWVTPEDDAKLSESGSFPNNLSELSGKY